MEHRSFTTGGGGGNGRLLRLGWKKTVSMRWGKLWRIRISLLLWLLLWGESVNWGWNTALPEFIQKTSFSYEWACSLSSAWVGLSMISILYMMIILGIGGLVLRGGNVWILVSGSEIRTQMFFTSPNLSTSNAEWVENVLLTNQLNQIHPPLFFISIYILLRLWLTIEHECVFQEPYRRSENGLWLKWLGRINITLLLLGGWWAQQEGNWGGWWNWDPSETFALLLLSFTLFQFHLLTARIAFGSRLKGVQGGIGCLSLIFTFIQINFDVLSHNFGLKFVSFFESTSWLQLWGCGIWVMVVKLQEMNMKVGQRKQFRMGGGRDEFMWVVWWVGMSYIGSSFAQITGYFWWEIRGGIGGRGGMSLVLWNWMVLILLIFRLLRVSPTWLYASWFAHGNMGWINLLGITNKRNDTAWKVHALILVGIFVILRNNPFEMWLTRVGGGDLRLGGKPITVNMTRLLIWVDWCTMNTR